MKNLKKSQILKGATATLLLSTLSTNALAAININFKSEFAKQITENKAGDVAQAVADQAVNLGGVVDILKNWDSYTSEQRVAALNTIPVLTTGSTYSVYNSADSAVGGTTANGPTVRIGAGSSIPTRQEGGQTVLDADDVESGTFGGVTTKYAGNVTYGAVSIGNKETGEYRTGLNFAAGRVTADSTDAINGSQLYAAQQGINENYKNITNLTNKVNQGLNIAGTTGKDNVQLGETITYKGASSNINTTVTDNTVAFELGDTVSVANKVATGDVYISTAGISGGNKKVTNVAPGTLSNTSTDAVNGSQLHATNQNVTNVTNKVNEGFNIADGSKTDNVKLGETVTYKADSNTKVAVGDNTVTIGLADNVAVTGNITAGGTVSTGGVSMSSKGFNAGNTVITNVADGAVTSTSKEAVNGSQLYALQSTINSSGKPATWTITDGTNNDTMNGGETLTYAGSDNVKTTVSDNQIKFDLGESIAISKNITAGGTISTGTVSMSSNGVNAGNKKVTNVAPGTLSNTSTDAVNGSQLHATNNNVTNLTNKVNEGFNIAAGTKTDNVKLGETITYESDENTEVAVEDNKVIIGLANDISVNNITATGGVNIGGVVYINSSGINAGGTKITNVADGAVTSTSKEAVNGSQLYALQNQITNSNKTSSWTITDGTNSDTMNSGEKLTYAGTSNVKTTVSDNQVLFDLGDNVAVNGNITAGGTVSTGNVSMSQSGFNSGGNKIVNVANGTLSNNSTDAVNGSQLNATNQNVTNITNKVNQGFTLTGNSGSDNVQLGDTVKISGTDGNIKSTVSDGKVDLALNDNVTVNTSLTVGTKGITIDDNGLDVKNTTINNVAAGEVSATSTQAVNGSQLYNAISNVSKQLGDVVYYDAGSNHTSVTFGGTNATTPVTLKNVAAGEVSNTSTQAVNGSQLYEVKTDVTNIKNEVAKGYTFAGDTGSQNFKMGSTVNVKGDGNVVTNVSNGTITVGLADDVNVKGNLTVNNNVTLNGGKITGVGKGDVNENSTDVVNGSQLHETNQNVTNITNKVNQGWNLTDDKGNTTNVQMGGTVQMSNEDGNVDITVKEGKSVINLSDKIKVTELKTENVTVNNEGIDMGDTKITNVKAGTDATDAVNVGQLNSAINQVNNRIDKVEDDAKAGTAAAIAVASLGQPWEYGRNTISVAGSAYDGKAGWAVGGGHITDNGRWMVKYNASGSDNKKYGFGASATYQY